MFHTLADYWLVMPVIWKQLKTITKTTYAFNLNQEKDQVFLCVDEQAAIAAAKKLAAIYPDDQIGIFKCNSVVEATGICPHVIKKFNEKGELIPVEVFLGRR